MRTLSVVTVAVALLGCGTEELASPEPTAALEQGLGTAWLLELDGTNAGYVSAVTSGTGGAPCGATSLRLSLGPNMSKAARAWLESVLARQQLAHDAAIYLASSNQRLGFGVSSVNQLGFPRAASGDASLAFFTVTLSTSKPAACARVSSTVMAQKSAAAASWASRYARASTIDVHLRGKVASAPASLASDNATIGDVEVKVGRSEASALWDLIQSVMNKKAIEFGGVMELGLIPRDQFGQPLLGVRWYGPASVVTAEATDGGAVAELRVDRAHLTAPLSDGGVE